ncbi:MAG: cyclic nucleotide-binding domain-containing protein [Muribaculaceae bacterium]|nr:cyclic nucleotide-binding domain-containing protein [Muribaculaceae bacterium]
MKRHFNTHLEGLDIKYWHDLIESRGKVVTLKKGEYLCRKGEPTNICGYVKSGYFIYTVDGVNKIGGFAFPEALVGDYPSCLYNAPAMFDIVAGKKSEVYIIDATLLPEKFEENREAGRQGRLFMESAYISLVKRYYALYAKTPIERYIDLINSHPQIEQDVPQKEIAEYLQILPNSLSRIKKKLLGK